MTEAREAFFLIMVEPYHDAIVHICKALTPLLLQAGYSKAHEKHNLWGIISPTDSYAAKYSKDFSLPERIGAYPSILQDAINQTQIFEDIWKIRIEDYAL